MRLKPNKSYMILNGKKILSMTATEFDEIRFKKIKVVTKNEINIAGRLAKEFNGFISGFLLAANPPHLIGKILFVDENVSPKINLLISDEKTTSINIYQIERIEIN